jgi:hypothetical protein
MAHTYGDKHVDDDDADERYHESSDEDFNPETAPVEEASSSEDEDTSLAQPPRRKGKRKAPADEEALDSGDEVTIQAARKKRAKKKKGNKGNKEDEDDLILSDDEGGDGGLVKTRAQRRVQEVERRPLVRTDGATVDVDALWAQMIAAPLKPVQPVEKLDADTQNHHAPVVSAPVAVVEEEQIAIKKVYTFAGQDTTEEKQIPRSHLDKYLKDGWKTADTLAAKSPTDEALADSSEPAQPKVRRPLRRPTRFDPNPSGYVRALAPEYQLSWPRTTATELPGEQESILEPEAATAKLKPEKTQKLNVVDKSRMDWTGFVDKEGIADELDTHGKTKEAYLGRMDFLAGVEARREDERRNLKIKAAAATMS